MGLCEVNCTIDLARKDGVTALMMASQNGHGLAVEELLRFNASVNVTRNEDGGTPLMFASMFGHFRIVEKLLEAGADKDYVAENGGTAIKFAAQNRQYEVVKRLQIAGASGTKGMGKAVDINDLFKARQ